MSFKFTNIFIISFPWYFIFLIIAEQLIGNYILLQITRSGLFFIICCILAAIIYGGHGGKINSDISKLLFSPSRIKSKNKLYHHQILYRHLTEHNKICNLVLRGGDEVFNRVMLLYFGTQVPINIYFLRQIIFLNFPILERTVIWCIILFQLASGLIVIGPLAWCNQIYHKPIKWIPKLQVVIGQGPKGGLWYKMKYDDLYNRLIQGPKIALKIGPIKSITYFSALEFVFIYLGYLLMAFSQIITLQATDVNPSMTNGH